MKRITLVALGAMFLSAGVVSGQTKKDAKAAKSAAPAATAPASASKQQKLLRVRTLETAQENQEFQNNVQVMQAQRAAVMQLDADVKKESDAKKKAELQKKLDEALEKLNKDDQTMQRVYGFSLMRNYTMQIEKSHLYMFVTDEEAAKIEADQAKAAKEAAKAPAKDAKKDAKK